MRKPVGMGLLIAALLCPAVVRTQPARIGVDPRVELLSIVFRLAGNPEYSQGRVPAYLQAIDAHFGPFRDHAAVQLARKLRQTDGVSFDAVASMAIHVRDVESLSERIPFDRPGSKLEKRWHGVKAREFLTALRQFTVDTKFEEFLKSQQPLYDLTNRRFRAFVEANADMSWFDRFFGAKAHPKFVFVPALVNGPSNYGPSIVAEDESEELYAILGVGRVDSDGQPQFTSGSTGTLVHEFVHSYANPLIDRSGEKLEAAGSKLYGAVRQAMNRQAYGSGGTVLYESLVRASTVRYLIDHNGAEAGQRAVRDEEANAFLWTGELVELLGQYEKDRTTYPTLEAFMPRVVEFFNGAAARVDDLVSHYEERRPRVVSMTVTNGAQDVDPGLTEIVVKFDRPMRPNTWSVARTSIVPQPKIGKVHFDETGTVFTIPVTLETDHEYAFSLNWPGGGSFASQDGVALKDVPVRFRTR